MIISQFGRIYLSNINNIVYNDDNNPEDMLETYIMLEAVKEAYKREQGSFDEIGNHNFTKLRRKDLEFSLSRLLWMETHLRLNIPNDLYWTKGEQRLSRLLVRVGLNSFNSVSDLDNRCSATANVFCNEGISCRSEWLKQIFITIAEFDIGNPIIREDLVGKDLSFEIESNYQELLVQHNFKVDYNRVWSFACTEVGRRYQCQYVEYVELDTSTNESVIFTPI